MGLFALIVSGAVGVAVRAFSLNRLGEEGTYANFLAQEGIEAARAIASRGYFNLSNGSHGLTFANSLWEFSGTGDNFDRFTRVVIVSNVYRNAGGQIVPSGGNLDLFTKRVEARVSWNFTPVRPETVSAKTYFAYWQSPVCEWDSAVQVGGANLTGTGDAQDIEVAGNYAYVATARNGSAEEFFVLSLANPTAPSVSGRHEVGDHANAVSVSGTFAYLATSRVDQEFLVVNVSNPASPGRTATVNVPNVSQANDVFVSGIYAYVVTPSSVSGPEFYIYDVSNPVSPQLRGSFEIGNHVYGVYAAEGRAYLANARSDKELLILNVSNPAVPSEIGSYDVPLAGANGQSVFYGAGVVHLTTRDNAGPTPEYYLLEASDPSQVLQIGALDISGRTNAVEAAVGFAILATEKTDQELMILNLANPASPAIAFSLDLNGLATGVALRNCYAYFSSADDAQEVKVVTPQ